MQSKGASSSLPSSEIPEKITVITSITPSALLSHDLVIDDEDRGASITGRWTAQEHHLFLRGLKRYGRAWSKIAKTIPNRTTTQVRTHAQKYFIKLERARSAPTTTCGPLYPAPNVGSINQHVLIPANSTQGFQTSNSTDSTIPSCRLPSTAIQSSQSPRSDDVHSHGLHTGSSIGTSHSTSSSRSHLRYLQPSQALLLRRLIEGLNISGQSSLDVHVTNVELVSRYDAAISDQVCIDCIGDSDGVVNLSVASDIMPESMDRQITVSSIPVTLEQGEDLLHDFLSPSVLLSNDNSLIDRKSVEKGLSTPCDSESSMYASVPSEVSLATLHIPTWFLQGQPLDQLLCDADTLLEPTHLHFQHIERNNIPSFHSEVVIGQPVDDSILQPSLSAVLSTSSITRDSYSYVHSDIEASNAHHNSCSIDCMAPSEKRPRQRSLDLNSSNSNSDSQCRPLPRHHSPTTDRSLKVSEYYRFGAATMQGHANNSSSSNGTNLNVGNSNLQLDNFSKPCVNNVHQCSSNVSVSPESDGTTSCSQRVNHSQDRPREPVSIDNKTSRRLSSRRTYL